MSQDNPSYPVMELSIMLVDRRDDAGGEHIKAGDITDIRMPTPGIGRNEATRFLWLPVKGLEREQMYRLKQPLMEPRDDTGQFEPPEEFEFFEKRRYCIPLDRLKQKLPILDLSRAGDRFERYQPGKLLDEDTMTFLEGAEISPLFVQGLVFDKVTMKFI